MVNDKMLHLIVGLFATAIIALPCYFFAEPNSLGSGLWSAIGIIVAGCVKEYCDYQYNGKWDWKDLGCTVLGVVMVCLFIVLMHFGKG